MPTSVRIVRAAPQGQITEADSAVPVIVMLHWHRGEVVEMDATALAWTANAVQIEWRSHLGLRADWIPIEHVRNPELPPRPNRQPPPQRRR